MAKPVVVDASALVDVLVGTPHAAAVRARLDECLWHAPAHLDAEVLSALGRLSRAGHLDIAEVDERLALVGSMPLSRQPLPPLLAGAWGRRGELRLVDALYVELAHQLSAPLITTDRRLARATPLAEAVTP
ncbi:MAG: type II toxin-antitoxin system VapC family toxin [Propionibacteriales bacterium]|nr:type II toxin-antitoxin system VapC family toxin [Propionibacteriales bacterium]